jgi:hypothetical protein
VNFDFITLKVKMKSGEVCDLKTGQAMRLIQSGDAIELANAKEPDDKPKTKPNAKSSKADSSANVSGD